MDKANLQCLTNLAILGIIVFVIVQAHKARIREELKKNNATNISIIWLPLDFDKSNQTYKVRYKDNQGSWQSKICKIHVLGTSIYWKEDDFPW